MAVQNAQILYPFVVLVTNNPELRMRVNYVNTLEQKLASLSSCLVHDFEEQLKLIYSRNQMERTRADLKLKLSAEGLALYPEYVNRVNILKDLGYIDRDDRGTYTLVIKLFFPCLEFHLIVFFFSHPKRSRRFGYGNPRTSHN